jgi:hypothetical protein
MVEIDGERWKEVERAGRERRELGELYFGPNSRI